MTRALFFFSISVLTVPLAFAGECLTRQRVVAVTPVLYPAYPVGAGLGQQPKPDTIENFSLADIERIIQLLERLANLIERFKGALPAGQNAPAPLPPVSAETPRVDLLAQAGAVFNKHDCVRCHHQAAPGGPAPKGGLDLTNADQVRAKAADIYALTNTGQMPPPPAAGDFSKALPDKDVEILRDLYLYLRKKQ